MSSGEIASVTRGVSEQRSWRQDLGEQKVSLRHDVMRASSRSARRLGCRKNTIAST